MNRNKRAIAIMLLGVSILAFHGDRAESYLVSGDKWPGSPASVDVYYSGLSGSNATFDTAFMEALGLWNGLAQFSFVPLAGSADPCADPNVTNPDLTGWSFSPTYCGTTFGASTLAVNIRWAGGGTIVQAGTVFNTAWTWDVHSGSGANIDFKRVAAHEVGHALGLNHDNTFTALMNTTYSSTVEAPQADDIDGIIAIYGALVTTWPDATSPAGDSIAAQPTFTWTDTPGGPYQLLLLNSVGTSVYNQKNITSCAAGTCTWTPPAALSAGLYQWKVRSTNGGNGPWSNGPVFTVGGTGTTTLASPTPTSPTSGTTANNTPSFTWTDVAGAVSYQLLVVDNAGLSVYNQKNITSCVAGTCTSTPGALSNGLHMWKVRAADGSGWGPWSAMPRFYAP